MPNVEAKSNMPIPKKKRTRIISSFQPIQDCNMVEIEPDTRKGMLDLYVSQSETLS